MKISGRSNSVDRFALRLVECASDHFSEEAEQDTHHRDHERHY